MKYEISFIYMAVLLSLSVASAVEIDPGQTIYINCNDTNASVPVVCGSECNTTCPECSVCTIDKELRPGELYEKQEGVCDIEIAVDDCDDSTEIRQRNYLIDISVDKHEGDEINLGIEIRDPFGTVIDNKYYEPFSESDILSAKYRYNVTCPAKLLVDTVDQQSCFKFFDVYIGENDPLSYILATQTTEYKEDLMNCQGELIAVNSLMKDNKDLYTDCQSQLHLCEERMHDARFETNQTKIEVTGKIAAATREMVPGVWASWAVMEAVVIIVLVCFLVFTGGDL